MKLSFLSFLFIAVCAGLSGAAPLPRIPIPPANEILSRLDKEHPRLLASKRDFDDLRQAVETNAVLGGWYQTVYRQAEKILGEPASRYEIPDGLRLLATSRQVVFRIYTLGMAWKISGEKRFADRAWVELDAAGRFKDWNTRHFLDTAEMTHAFAIGYDWFYDFWTPEQRTFLRTAMIDKGLNPGLNIERKKSYWSVFTFNWNQVCNGGLGMGALAIADEEPALCGEFLHDALESLQLPMASFAPDGGWDEGPGYWNYATSYNVTFLAALRSALHTDFGLDQLPGFAETGLFPIYMTSPDDHVFDFADGHDRPEESPQLFWLARDFNRPEFAAFAQKFAKGNVFELLWYLPADPDSISKLPLDKYFRHAETATFRGDWKNRDATFVGFKAGSNRASHGHLDLGSFVLDSGGERWAVDLGSDDYNLPGYFNTNKGRWNYYRLRAEGHNTLVLGPDNSGGPDQNVSASTKINRFESKPARAFAIADLTPAYSRNALSVQRGIALLDRTNVLVEDEIQARAPAELYWFMHTPASIRVNGRSAILTLHKKHLYARILSPSDAVFTTMKAAPLPSSPHPARQAVNKGISKLTIKMKNVETTRLTVLFTPVAEGVKRDVPVVPLRDW